MRAVVLPDRPPYMLLLAAAGRYPYYDRLRLTSTLWRTKIHLDTPLNLLYERSQSLLVLHIRFRRTLEQRIELAHRQILVIFPVEAGDHDFGDQAAYPFLLLIRLSCFEILRKNARLLPDAGAYEKHARLPGSGVIAHDHCLDTRWVCGVDESVFSSTLVKDVVGLTEKNCVRGEISIFHCALCTGR